MLWMIGIRTVNETEVHLVPMGKSDSYMGLPPTRGGYTKKGRGEQYDYHQHLRREGGQGWFV